MKKMTLSQLHCNLKTFSKEFIGAGSRNSVVGLYRKLIELGAIPSSKEKDNSLISSKQKIVILCVNDGIRSKFARISLHERSWWDYWHNKAHKHCKPAYITYNVPKQMSTVISNLNIKELETLIPE